MVEAASRVNLQQLAAEYPVRLIVDRGAGHILDQALVIETGLSDEEARLLVRRGGVWLGRQRILDPDWQPPAGAELTLHTPPGGRYTALEIAESDILYEDQWLLALNKQPGWFAVPTPWDIEANIDVAVRRFYARRGSKTPTHLAHRLDRETSGVLLVSKDPALNSALLILFNSGGVSKRYLALAAGSISEDEFSVRTGHGRGVNGLFRIYPQETIGQRIGPQQKAIKEAHTRFKVLQRLDGATLVEAEPYTGRTHQIRLHLTALGHPVLGDRRYGGPQALGDLQLEHHLLHAYELGLQHPISAERLLLQAPLPQLFDAALERLRREAGLDSKRPNPYNSRA